MLRTLARALGFRKSNADAIAEPHSHAEPVADTRGDPYTDIVADPERDPYLIALDRAIAEHDAEFRAFLDALPRPEYPTGDAIKRAFSRPDGAVHGRGNPDL